MLGTWDKIVENMRKKELIKQLQNREPLLANAVSHMVEYIYSRPLPCGISKQSTDQSCERLSAERLCRWGRQHVREEPRTSTYRFAEHQLPPSVYWIVASLTDYKTYLTILRTIRSIICRREDMECTADFLFWLYHL